MFPQQALEFLEDLKINNNRDWFQANQDRYKTYKQTYRDTVEAFVTEISKSEESLQHLEFKNCSFRINRDVRFSKDKAPYKTNMGIWMSAGTKNFSLAGYYIHIEKGASFIAGGMYQPNPAELKKIRREIAGFHEDLEEITNNKELNSIYGGLERTEKNSLKTAPKGYEKDHIAIEFLRLKSFVAVAKLDDKDLESDNFIQETTQKLLVLKPLVEFINRALTTE
ncbi:MAG: TIGR02453 family protein [Flavobacterium sp. MedPE-SWcel]|uniref:DUF2461 domain-containing protein n=1 Tax=uncultured Flavobacterium sp. TaxID=165435 RepID=UPI00091552E3|nr:DUF2461 domain-containing protein [uncultured Flavobacterium sp.]OIQ16265.1 MAG: TIGR02453 family protein [Flavobacterium sp. MedPE-SWcel]